MKGNDWLAGFLIGILLVAFEVGYLAHYTSMSNPVYNWAQELKASVLFR